MIGLICFFHFFHYFFLFFHLVETVSAQKLERNTIYLFWGTGKSDICAMEIIDDRFTVFYRTNGILRAMYYAYSGIDNSYTFTDMNCKKTYTLSNSDMGYNYFEFRSTISKDCGYLPAYGNIELKKAYYVSLPQITSKTFNVYPHYVPLDNLPATTESLKFLSLDLFGVGIADVKSTSLLFRKGLFQWEFQLHSQILYLTTDEDDCLEFWGVQNWVTEYRMRRLEVCRIEGRNVDRVIIKKS